MRRGIKRERLVTRPFAMLTASALAYFTGYGVLLPTLPRYVQQGLHRGNVAVGVIVAGLAISALLCRPFVGQLGDARGRKILVVGGAAIVLLATLLMIPVGDPVTLFCLRLLTGVGEAMFFVGAVSAINDMAPESRRGEAVSLFTVSLYGGLTIGPFLGETVLHAATYDTVWAMASGFYVLALVLGSMVHFAPRPEPDRTARRRILHPAGVIPGVIMFTSVCGYASFSAFVTLYARELHLSGAKTLFVMYGAILVSIRLFGARIPDRFGIARIGRFGLGMSALGLGIIGVWRGVPALFIGAATFAIGQAVAFPAFMALAASNAPPAERGAAVGTTTAFIDLGFGIGPLTAGVVAATFGRQQTFTFGAVLAVLGVGLQIALSKGKHGTMLRAPSRDSITEAG